MTDEAEAPEEQDEESHEHADGSAHSHSGGDESHHHHGDETHDHDDGDETHDHDESAHDSDDGEQSHEHQDTASEEETDGGEGDENESSEEEPAEVVQESEEADTSEEESSEEGASEDESEPAADGGDSEDEDTSEEVSDEEDGSEEESEPAADEDDSEEPAESSDEDEDTEEAFEVRLVGGLSVLRDSHDPLYVMQATTNLASTLVIGWTMIALVLGWHEGEAANNGWWVLIAFALGLTVILVVVLEAFLSHDLVLQQKMEDFSRWTQYFMATWLIGLYIWSNGDGGPDLRGAEPLLEMTVVWVLLFIMTEFVNRFKLGKMEWKGGRDVMSIISSSVGGVKSMVTGTEIKQMKASSRSVMEGIRWVLDFCSLLFFLMIVILTAASTGTTMEDALTHLPLGLDSYGLDVVVKPALWLGSIYLLIFLSETWLRIRPDE